MGSAWSDIKKYGGDAVQAGTLGAYNPNTGSGWASPIINGPAQGSTAPGTAAIANSAGLQTQFGNLAGAFKGAYDPTQAGINTGNQNANITQLQAQANGTAPSAAELQLQQQGAKNAAGAYGLAAALQGRNPGQALMSAQNTALQTQAGTNAQAAQMRAQEQATGQTALAGALSGMQGQQTALRSQDLGNVQSLYGNQLAAGGQQVTAAGGVMGANTTNAATSNSYNGAVLNAAGGAAAAAAKSDRTEKTDIKAVGDGPLMKLAEALKAYGFEYKHPGTPGEAPGARGGIMAQDAVKGGDPGGMVKTDAFGKLDLDIGNAAGTALAMSAAALRRTKGRGGMVKGEAFQKAA